jgi:hypothetical protein
LLASAGGFLAFAGGLTIGQLDFLHTRENLILLGPPSTGKTRTGCR